MRLPGSKQDTLSICCINKQAASDVGILCLCDGGGVRELEEKMMEKLDRFPKSSIIRKVLGSRSPSGKMPKVASS